VRYVEFGSITNVPKISPTGGRCKPAGSDTVNKAEKKVVDTSPLNLINSKAYEPIGFRGMSMSSGREGA
jgi:hypothetical protein